MNKLEWLHADMFMFALAAGREKPALSDLLNSFRKWSVVPEFHIMNDKEFCIYGKGVDSPTLIFSFAGNELVTESFTNPVPIEALTFFGLEKFAQKERP